MFDRATAIEIAAGLHDISKQYMEDIAVCETDTEKFSILCALANQALVMRDWIVTDILNENPNPDFISQLNHIIVMWESELFLTRVE